MMTTVTGVFPDVEAAKRVVERATFVGFTTSNISVVAAETSDRGNRTACADREAEATGNTPRGVIASIGGGTFFPLVFFVIGTVGLIGFGPLVAALSSGGVMAGGVQGGLVGHGLSPRLAREYETAIRAGRVIVGIQAGRARVSMARELLAQGEAERIADSLHVPVPVPIPEVAAGHRVVEQA